MSWRKYLLVPRVATAAMGRVPAPEVAWDLFWRDVHRTGPDGEVLWDGADELEMRWWLDTAREHLDRSLPVVDVGAGNGRLSRLLADSFPSVLGLDVSPAAILLASRESSGRPNLSFQVLDITAEGVGAALSSQLGPANVVVRGVFHVLDTDGRRRAAANLAEVLAGRGSLLLGETNYPGDLLEYLEYLGGRSGRLPSPLARLIDHKTPRPSAFGAAQLAEMFPTPAWTIVSSGAMQIAPVRSLGSAAGRTIPGFYAVVRAGRQAAELNERHQQLPGKR